MIEFLQPDPEHFDTTEAVHMAVATVRELTNTKRRLSDAMGALTDDQREAFIAELGRQKAEYEPVADEGEEKSDLIEGTEAYDLTHQMALMTFAFNRSRLNELFHSTYQQGMGWNKRGE